ncbi:RT0821/Lpp0805 family surface protein [Candidatus Parabeggiatoa sp. HSG14]|uniref:RT0821/Lpp0805 family surface protein n=1 Tax=Candidatus Parabeggiatoa sp. HSG14 TaxID=3055593 RepID=UPI0025A7F3F1|nr:RT0821/Lpp0805 family surface protein [Thiotrichales bacterium HSG14]
MTPNRFKFVFITLYLLFIAPITSVAAIDELRLNPDMHTDDITDMAVDPLERYMVTSSKDKTVRVWTLPNLKLRRVLRLDESVEGPIYAVAIHPKGKTIAIGGHTGCDTEGKNCTIYLFDYATGKLKQSIAGHSGDITYLAFSPDIHGRYLLAIHKKPSSGENALRIYRTLDYSYVQDFEDTEDKCTTSVNHADSVNHAEFDKKGQLVTTCDDGFVRLYDSNFNLLKKGYIAKKEFSKKPEESLKWTLPKKSSEQTSHEKSSEWKPHIARFSPSGKQIAIECYKGLVLVNISIGNKSTQSDSLSFENAKRAFKNPLKGDVVWSQDGQLLFAGSEDSLLRYHLIEGEVTPVPNTGNLVAFHPLADGSIVFRNKSRDKSSVFRDKYSVFENNSSIFGNSSGFGLLQLDNKTKTAEKLSTHQVAEVAKFDELQLIEHAGQIEFCYRKKLHSFSLEDQRHLKMKGCDSSLENIAWANNNAPKNVRKILEKEDFTLLEIDTNYKNKQIILLSGTLKQKENVLMLFNTRGEKKWKVSVPEKLTNIYFHEDGDYLFVFGSDDKLQSLYAYRLDNGKKLLDMSAEHDVSSVLIKLFDESGNNSTTDKLNEFPFLNIINNDIVMAKLEDNTAQGYRLKDGKKWPEGSYIREYAVSKDKQILMLTQPYPLVLRGHKDFVRSVAFSPDGQTLATSSQDKTARLWQVSSGKLLHTLRHTSSVWSAAFSPNGQTLATTSYHDNTARLWQVSSGKLLHTLEGHKDSVRSVAFSPDSQMLATSSEDKTARLWQVSSGKLLRTFTGVRNVAFSPDSQTLATSSNDNTASLWQVSSGKLLRIFKGHKYYVKNVAFSPDGQMLATVSNKTARLWQVSSGKLLHTLKGHKDYVWSVAFSPDGLTLATASKDRTARLWQVSSGKLLHTLKGHKDYVWSVAFSPDGLTLATASRDRTARLWQVSSGQLLRTLRGVGSKAVFSPNSQTLAATSSSDNTLRLWQVSSGKLRHNLRLFDTTQQKWEKNISLLSDELNTDNIFINGEKTPVAIVRTKGYYHFYHLDDGKELLEKVAYIEDYYTATTKGLLVRINGSLQHLQVSNSEPSLEKFPKEVIAKKVVDVKIIKDSHIVILILEDDTKQYYNLNGHRLLPKISDQVLKIEASTEQNVFVVSLTDGTVRWYNLNNGKELLALFPYISATNPHTTHWILWTPKGYYDASLGGEELIGWQVNYGPNTAPDFFTAAQFRKYYYRPDIISQVWEKKDPDEAIFRANQKSDYVPEVKPEIRKLLTTYYPHDVVDNVLTAFDIENALKLMNQQKGYSLPSKLQTSHTMQESLPPVVTLLAVDSKCDTSENLTAEETTNEGAGEEIKQEIPIRCPLSTQANNSLLQGNQREKTIDHDFCFSQTEVNLYYNLRRPSAKPITTLKVLADGRLLGKIHNKKNRETTTTDTETEQLCDLRPEAQSRGKRRHILSNSVNCELPQDNYALRVSLPPRDVKISLIAENQFSASEPYTIRLHWTGNDSNLYVLAVGVDDKASQKVEVKSVDDKASPKVEGVDDKASQKVEVDKTQHLSKIENDALCFAEAMKAQQGKSFAKVNIRLLQKTKGHRELKWLVGKGNQTMARKKAILKNLQWLEKEVTVNDVAMLFLAGQGSQGDDGQYYFLPRNIDKNDITGTGVSYNEITKTLTTLPGNSLFFTDVCDATPNRKDRPTIHNPLITNELSQAKNGVTIFAANYTNCNNKDEAEKERKNGRFTKALWEGLHSKEVEENKDGKITLKRLGLHLSKEIKALTVIPKTIDEHFVIASIKQEKPHETCICQTSINKNQCLIEENAKNLDKEAIIANIIVCYEGITREKLEEWNEKIPQEESGQKFVQIGQPPLVGEVINNLMDFTDVLATQQALSTQRTGQAKVWTSPDSQAQFAVTPTRTHQNSNGDTCRDFTTSVVTADGKEESVDGTACRLPDGSWKKFVQLMPPKRDTRIGSGRGRM